MTSMKNIGDIKQELDDFDIKEDIEDSKEFDLPTQKVEESSPTGTSIEANWKCDVKVKDERASSLKDTLSADVYIKEEYEETDIKAEVPEDLNDGIDKGSKTEGTSHLLTESNIDSDVQNTLSMMGNQFQNDGISTNKKEERNPKRNHTQRNYTNEIFIESNLKGSKAGISRSSSSRMLLQLHARQHRGKVRTMDVELLISEVFAVRAIWDPKEQKHSDRNYIGQKWNEIGGRLGVSGEQAKRKFKILRDQFRVELKKVPVGKSGDPGLPVEDYLSSWPYFRMLFFLRDTMMGRKMVGNAITMASQIRSQVMGEEHNYENDSNEIPFMMAEYGIQLDDSSTTEHFPSTRGSSPLQTVSDPSSSCYGIVTQTEQANTRDISEPSHSRSRSRSSSASRTKRSEITEAQQQLLSIEKEKIEYLKKTSESSEDPERLFLLSLLPLLKNLPAETRSQVKIKILTTLHDATYG